MIVWWVVQAAAAVVVTIVSRHEKTWELIVSEQNDASLVHDDGFYPHWDETTV
jgi:hypothetical protein